MYRYKLKECEENNNINRRSINGIVLKKNEWVEYQKKCEKLESFDYLIDCVEFDGIKEIKKAHEELIIKQKEENIIREQEEDTKIIEKFKEIERKVSIDKKSGDEIIDLSYIQQLENKKVKVSVDDLPNKERIKYESMSMIQLIDLIIASDPKNYDRKDFKGRKKEDLLQTLYVIKKI